MEIGVMGVGIVGGATADFFEKYHEVFRYDKFKPKYSSEQDLERLVQNSKSIFLCVPTPMNLDTGEIDYSCINDSMKSLYEKIKEIGRKPEEILVTIRSTAIPGTTNELSKKYPLRFAFNPEFLREKHADYDMKNPTRIVIGANNAEDRNLLKEIYMPLLPDAPYIEVPALESEMIKYASNVTLAVQIINANEMYQICQKIGADYDQVKKGLLLDPRIGKNLDVPGYDGDFGFGGKCFPKDLRALITFAKKQGYESKFLEEAWATNLVLRKNKDWLKIKGATSNNNYL